MLQYNHTKIELATVVAKNLSKRTNEPVYVVSNGIKSVKTMKFVDTTVLQVCRHSELPVPTSAMMLVKIFHKGKKRVV